MRPPLGLTLGLALGGMLALHAQAPAPAKTAADLAKLGPAIGQRVPDFSLVDQHGSRKDLGAVLGPNGAMLVFFRSADW
jgi:hypothetical protein